jgi:hypothetical protein
MDTASPHPSSLRSATLAPAGRGVHPLDLTADFPAIPEGWAYLDTAATAQKPRPVIDAIARGYSETYATVHRGVYQRSAEMTLAFEAARRTVAQFIGAAAPEEVVFVRGATEAINLVAQSWGGTFLKPGDRILLSVLEHHSNIVPWQMIAERTGAVIDVAPLTEDGRIDLDAAGAMLTERHTCRTCSAPCSTPAAPPRSRTASAHSSSSTAARRYRAWRSTSRASVATSTSFPPTSFTGPRESGSSGAAATCSTRCRPSRAAAP